MAEILSEFDVGDDVEFEELLKLDIEHDFLNLPKYHGNEGEEEEDEEEDLADYTSESAVTVELVSRKRKIASAEGKTDRLPRIVRHDIRRHYPRMMVNIFNSRDPTLVQSFFLTYAGKELYLRNVFCGVGVAGDPIGMTQKLQRNNPLPQLEILLNMWHAFSTLHPDIVIEECPTEFYMQPGSRITVLRSQTIIKFTRLYSANLYAFIKQVIKATQTRALLHAEGLSNSSDGSSSSSNASISSSTEDDDNATTPTATGTKRNSTVKSKRQRHKMSLLTPVQQSMLTSGLATNLPYQEIDPFELYAELHQGATIPRLAHPMTVHLRTTSTLYVNERRQIIGIDFGAPQIVLGSLYEAAEIALKLLYNAAWSIVPPSLVRLFS